MYPVSHQPFNLIRSHIKKHFQYWRRINVTLMNMLHLEYPDEAWELFDKELIPLIQNQAPWPHIKSVFYKIESMRLDWRYPRNRKDVNNDS